MEVFNFIEMLIVWRRVISYLHLYPIFHKYFSFRHNPISCFLPSSPITFFLIIITYLHFHLKPNDLIDLDGWINLGDKPEASKEPDGTGEQNNSAGHNQHVPKVQNRTSRFRNIQFTVEKVDSVQEKVHASHTTGQETPPPPVIVLSRQMKVAQ